MFTIYMFLMYLFITVSSIAPNYFEAYITFCSDRRLHMLTVLV